MNPLTAAYAGAARLRRTWYERRPQAQQRLDRPVISVGNLVVGGSGKTPAVAAIAGLLRERGERPAILSRGYGGRRRNGEVLIVGDGDQVLAPARESGDEPQLLARTLPGVPVLVARERALAGRVAAERFGCTVMLLDDGFQHLQLARDIDLLLVSPQDLQEHVLPAGALREPLDVGRRADAVLVPGTADDARRVGDALGAGSVFTVLPHYGEPVRLREAVPHATPAPGSAVLAVAGIARPLRFFTALRDLGWTVVREMQFRDHHPFSPADVRTIETAATQSGVRAVMTTAKDAVRLSELELALDWMYLPMRVTIEPEDAFADWLMARLRAARGAHA